jgi:DNA invertase Pin-like site-specific DNA recombinase
MALALAPIGSPEPATALYCRISSDARQDGLGVERQLEDCHALVRFRGWGPALEFTDNDVSASSGKVRPAYRAMLEAVKRGEVSRVVVWAVDRLYRKPTELEELITLSEAGRVTVVAVTGSELDLATEDGRLVARLLVSVARREAEGIAMRVKRQKQQRREAGLPHGGRIPFGWQDLMTPDPVQARAIGEAITAVVAGASLYDVAARWNADPALGRRMGSTPWSGNDVGKVLTAARHAGLVVKDGEVATDAEGAAIPAVWPAIVPRELWDESRAVLASRATGVGVPRRRGWLSGLVRCAACGSKLTRSNSGARPIWRCWKERGGCGGVSIVAAPMEAVVREALFLTVDSPALRAAVGARDDQGVGELRRELTGIDRQRSELVAAFAEGGSAAVLRQATDALEGRRRRLTAELGQRTQRSPLERFEEAGVLRAAWPDLTVDQQRAIVAAVFDGITVAPAVGRGCRFDPDRVSITWRA